MRTHLAALACGLLPLVLFTASARLLDVRTTGSAGPGGILPHGPPQQALSPEEASALARVKALLARGVSPNDTDEHGYIELMQAALFGYESVVDVVLAAGADPNRQTRPEGWTTPQNTVRNRHVGIARRLLEHGANPNVGDETMLISAVQFNSDAEMVQLLLEHGVNVNARDQDGRSALFYAGREPVIQLLTKAGLQEEKSARAAPATGSP